MVDHSQKWYDGSNSRKVSNGASDRIAAIANKLDNLGRDMKKLKENVHAIQVGCETCGGAYLDKECPLREDMKKTQEEIKEAEEIEEAVALHGPAPREVTPRELPVVSYYVAPYESSILFPRRFKQHAEEVLVYKTIESLKSIKVSRPILKEISQSDDYAKHIKNLVENKSRTSENEDVKMNTKCLAIF
ncbi:hypothetical protein Tco_0000631 [Tanacetum coccineum]